MPSLLNKQKPIRIVLDCDVDIDPQPAFLIKRLSFRQSRNIGELRDAMDNYGSVGDMFDDLKATLIDCIESVENMPSDLNDLVDNVLTFPEVMELLAKILQSGQTSTTEKN